MLQSLTSKLVAMTSQYRYKLALTASLILGLFFLASCQGLGTSPSPTTNTTVQLTVTGPTTSTGTVTSSPKGISCPGTCSASFASNTQVTLTEQPATNNFFSGWSGGTCSGSASTCTLTLTAATSISAAFNGGDSLTVAVTGTGSVTSNPTGISCPGMCTANFGTNTKITLTEAPKPGSGQYFSGWSGSSCSGTANTCVVTLAANSNVSAAFVPGVAMTVTLAGGGTGTVSSNPPGITCSATTATTCTASFAPNTPVTLSETPVAGDTFAGWSGACTGTAGCSVTLTAASNVTATFGGSLANINHIILYAQENRSFDHYFGAMRKYWADNGIPDQQFDGLPQFNPPFTAAPPAIPGCNIANSATDCTVDPTNMISSFHFTSACNENQSPFWNEAHNDWDYQNPADQPAEVNSSGQPDPPLNGFVWTAAYDARSDGFMDVMGVRAMGYYDGTDLNYYYALASDFGISDRWFAPVMSRTQINRMYILAATSYGYAYPEFSDSKDSALAPSMTIIQALQNAGVSWKIYINPTGLSDAGQACTTDYTDANAICMLKGFGSYIDEFTYFNTILASEGQTPDLLQNVAPIQQFAIDASSGKLASFSLIEPASSAGLDEHPSDSDGYPVNVQAGEQYSADDIINPLLQSPSWTDSALIFTYDEPGGYYDHVSPQTAALPGDGFNWPVDLQSNINDICTKTGEVEGQGTCSFGWTTYRVPNVVISPYSIKNYVSHTVRDTTSVLAMVEARFGLKSLTGRDASQPSMNEFFDFVNKPWATPPTLPTPAIGEPCDQTPPASWQEPPLLTVVVTPDSSGSVTSSPGSGIDGCTSSCSSTFANGTVVTLTATPSGSSTFTGWSGGGCSGTGTCSVTVSSSDPQTTVTATFSP